MKRSRPFAMLRIAILPALVVAAIIIAWWLGYFGLEQRKSLVIAVAEFRSHPGALPLFVLFWTLVVAFALPAALASVLGGAIFGPVLGALANWLAAVAATIVAHTLART